MKVLLKANRSFQCRQLKQGECLLDENQDVVIATGNRWVNLSTGQEMGWAQSVKGRRCRILWIQVEELDGPDEAREQE